jgi:hypothetical protein
VTNAILVFMKLTSASGTIATDIAAFRPFSAGIALNCLIGDDLGAIEAHPIAIKLRAS